MSDNTATSQRGQNATTTRGGTSDFSEGPIRKGGVNAAPPVPRPDVVPGAQNPALNGQPSNNGQAGQGREK
jgi:hypothetical protein